MKFSIDELQAAGVPDTLIVRLVREKSADKSEQWRKQKQKQRTCPPIPADIADTVHIEKKEVSQKEKKKKVSIPQNWKPSEADFQYARGKGWPPGRIEAEAERFRIHYGASGAAWKDWHLVWCKWVTSPYQIVNGGKRQGAYDDGFR